MTTLEPARQGSAQQAGRPVRSGAWYFILQVFTGFLLLAFVTLHLLANHQQGGDLLTFEQIVARLRTPLGLSVELGLLATISYHTVNGLRGVLLDLSPTPRVEAWINRGSVLLGLLIVAYGVWLTFSLPL